MSVKEVARILGISQGTSSLWLRDVVVGRAAQARLVEREASGWKAGIRAVREKKRLRVEKWRQEAECAFQTHALDPMFMLGIGLYWGEGSKSRATRLTLVNADVGVHRAWIRWFRSYVQPFSGLAITGRLNIHEGNCPKRAIRFWRKALDLDDVQIATVWPQKRGTGCRKNKWPHGILSLASSGKGATEWLFKTMHWIRMSVSASQV